MVSGIDIRTYPVPYSYADPFSTHARNLNSVQRRTYYTESFIHLSVLYAHDTGTATSENSQENCSRAGGESAYGPFTCWPVNSRTRQALPSNSDETQDSSATALCWHSYPTLKNPAGSLSLSPFSSTFRLSRRHIIHHVGDDERGITVGDTILNRQA